MKKIFPVLLVFLAACQSTENKSSEPPSAKETSEIPGCYLSVFGKDSTSLALVKKEDSISGNLNYYWFQKDNNVGYFSGTLQDSLLTGFYNFFSEGKYSVRQVVFKVKGDTLLEAYGAINMKNDTAFFKQKDHLRFLTDRPLGKTECPVKLER